MTERAPQPDDTALMQRAQAGDTDAFAELVRRYQRALLRVARSRLGRADWAEEVVQETFMAAFKSRASFDLGRGFRTWLWTILLNQCYGHYQRRQRGVPLASSGESTTAKTLHVDQRANGEPLPTLLAKERSEQLEEVLAQLSQVQADALRLRFFGGLKFPEIAETMQCSLNTAKARVRWGLVRMAELLQAQSAGVELREPEQERGQP